MRLLLSLLVPLALPACRGAPATVLLRIEAEAIPAPDELRLTVLGPGTVEVWARRVPEAGKPTLPNTVVLYPRAPVELRILARALAGGSRVAEGMTRIEARAGAQVSATITLRSAALPDRDKDGIPDWIDSCPDWANPEQGPCPAMEAGVAEARRDLPEDGPRRDLRDLPARDGPRPDKPGVDRPRVDTTRPDVPKPDAPRIDLAKPKPDLPKADLPKLKVDLPKADLLKTCDQLYGAASGYILCAQTATSCEFNANLNGGTCGALCAGFGGVCLGAYDNANAPGQECISLGPDTCSTVRAADICVCSR